MTVPLTSSEACPSVKIQRDLNTRIHSTRGFGDAPAALQGSTILITGAAGFVGSQLLFRLPSWPLRDAVKQVHAIIRGSSIECAIARLPRYLARYTPEPKNEGYSASKLIALNGDCSQPNLSLNSQQLRVAQRATILINAAADTRARGPLDNAIAGVVRPS